MMPERLLKCPQFPRYFGIHWFASEGVPTGGETQPAVAALETSPHHVHFMISAALPAP